MMLKIQIILLIQRSGSGSEESTTTAANTEIYSRADSDSSTTPPGSNTAADDDDTSAAYSTTHALNTTTHSTTSHAPNTTMHSTTTHAPNTTTQSTTTTHAPNTTTQSTTTHAPNTTTHSTTTHAPNTTTQSTTSHAPNTTTQSTTTHAPNTTTQSTTTHATNTTTQSTTSHAPNTTTQSTTTTHAPNTTTQSTTTHAPNTTTQSTTTHATNTTTQSTTTHVPNTTTQSTTTHAPNTTTQSTTTHAPNTMTQSTTIHAPNTTTQSTTTHAPNTTTQSTTTHAPNTTTQSTTTHAPNTTTQSTTTHAPNTTAQSTTTHAPNTTTHSTTTHAPNTTTQSTTTHAPNTTTHSTTTHAPNTTTHSTTTHGPNTTHSTTTDVPNTTTQSTVIHAPNTTMQLTTQSLNATTQSPYTYAPTTDTQSTSTDAPNTTTQSYSTNAANTTTKSPYTDNATTALNSTTSTATTQSIQTPASSDSTSSAAVVSTVPVTTADPFLTSSVSTTTSTTPSTSATSTTISTTASTSATSTTISTTPSISAQYVKETENIASEINGGNFDASDVISKMDQVAQNLNRDSTKAGSTDNTDNQREARANLLDNVMGLANSPIDTSMKTFEDIADILDKTTGPSEMLSDVSKTKSLDAAETVFKRAMEKHKDVTVDAMTTLVTSLLSTSGQVASQDSDVLEVDSETRNVQQDVNPQDKKLAEKTEVLLGTVTDTLLKKMGGKKQDLKIETPSLSIALKKAPLTQMQASRFDLKGSEVSLPKRMISSRGSNAVALKVSKMKVNPYKYGNGGQRTNTPVIQMAMQDPGSGGQTAVYMDEDDQLKLEIQTDYENHGNGNQGNGKRQSTSTKKLGIGDGNTTTLLTYTIVSEQAAFILRLDLIRASKYVIYGTLDVNKIDFVFRINISGSTFTLEKNWKVEVTLTGSSLQVFIPSKEIIFSSLERKLFVVVKKYEVTPLSTKRNQRSLRKSGAVTPPGGQVTAMTYEARYWKDGEWKTDDGLEITPNSTVENVVFKSNFFGTFCAGLFIPPNKIDFDAIIANFAERLNKTPHVLVTVIILLIVYAFCAVWARRADNRDRLMWEYRPIPGNSPDHENEYFVKVYTGLARGAGTTANVFIILTGIKADTGSRILTDGERKNFQRGNLNNFYITTREHLGELKNLCIWHDCYGDSSSWNLEKVVVYDPKDDCRYVFNCQQWLALDKADGQTCRRLSVYSLENLKTFNTLLSAHANNNLYEDHIWLSVTRRPNHSAFTRVQRLTCCFAILSLAMCTSAMWFETVDATQKGIELGVITITMQQITVGFMSSLVVVPPSVAMIELFRRRKRRMASKSCHVITLKIDKSFRFPWWTVFIAYFLAFASAFLGAFFSLFYSLEWGPEKTSSWLISLCLSFFQSVIVIQPIKVILVAVIFACLMKLPSDEEYEIRYERYTHDFIFKGSVNAIKVGKPPSVKAADKNESENSILIEQKREELHLDKKLTGYFKTVLRNMLCLLLLVLICDNNRSKSTFRLNKALKNLLVTPPKGNKFPDIMYWVRDTIIPGTYPRHSYNAEELPNYEKAFLPDVYAYRMGPARLRQLRVKAEHGCPQTILPSGIKGCALSYSYENEDRLNYSIGWESNQAPFAKECSWKPSQDFAKSFSGIYTYGSGGYSVELGMGRSSALNVVKRLVNFEWIDRRTRVLFVELLLYSANVNLFSNVKLVVEFPVSSGFLFSGHVFSFKPYPYVSSFDFLVFLAQIVWVIINVYFMVKCGIGIYKQKCAYLKDIWNCLQLFEVVLAMAAIGTFLARTFLIIQVVEKIMNNKGKFVSVDLLTDLDNGLTLLLAIALLTATIRLMKPLSFLETFAILKGTLRVSLHIVFSYSLIFAIISLAYGTLLFILFSSYLEAFHTLPHTMYQEFGMTLGIIKYKNVIVKDSWEAKTIIGSFYILNLIILMNMFVTVISDTMSSVKHSERIPGYDPKLSNHLMKKLHTLSAYVLTTLTRGGMTNDDKSSKPSRHEDDQVTVNEDMDAAVRLAIALEESFNKYYKSIIHETTIMNLQYINAKREQLQLKREVRETQIEVAKIADQLNHLQSVVKSLITDERQQSPWSNTHTCDCSDLLDVHWFHFPDGRLAFVIQSISGTLDSNLIEFAEIKDILLPTDIIGTAVTILSWKNILAQDDLYVGMPVESQEEGVSYMYYISFDLGVTWKKYPAELTTLKDPQNQEFRMAQVRLASLPTCFMLTGRAIHERESSLEIINETMDLVVRVCGGKFSARSKANKVRSVRLVQTADENTQCSPMVKLHVDHELPQKLKVNVELLGNPEKSGDNSCTDHVVMVRHGSSDRWREQHGTVVTSQDDRSVNFVLNVSHKWDCLEFLIKTRPSILLNRWNTRTAEVLDDTYLATLAVKLDRDWVQLAEELKVPSHTLQRLTHRRVKTEHERAYLMLESLRASLARAKRDKVKTLAGALMKINRVDLAIETLHYGEERQCVIQQYIEELKLIKAFAVALRSNDIVDNLPDLASLLGIPENQQEMSVDLSSDKGALPRSEEEKCMAIFLAWKDRTPNCSVALLQERLLVVPGWKAVADKIGCIE